MSLRGLLDQYSRMYLSKNWQTWEIEYLYKTSEALCFQKDHLILKL